MNVRIRKRTTNETLVFEKKTKITICFKNNHYTQTTMPTTILATTRYDALGFRRLNIC